MEKFSRPLFALFFRKQIELNTQIGIFSYRQEKRPIVNIFLLCNKISVMDLYRARYSRYFKRLLTMALVISVFEEQIYEARLLAASSIAFPAV